jgi:polyisoprenoid-binding protein YceI
MLRAVSIQGTHILGPDNARLTVYTKRTGAVAKAGHDLTLEVTSWKGTLEIGDESSASLDVDTTSFKVIEGTGGIQKLDDDDRRNIEQTIDDEVLRKQAIEFRSTNVAVDGDHLSVSGELTLMGDTHPLTFELVADSENRLSGSAVVKQSDWGMKPYTALFGALKVADEVEIKLDTSSLG